MVRNIKISIFCVYQQFLDEHIMEDLILAIEKKKQQQEKEKHIFKMWCDIHDVSKYDMVWW